MSATVQKSGISMRGDTPLVKTARFATIVESAGRPETHLLFVEPSKDAVLQKAVKSGRVMTVYQTNVGAKADHGKVGFEPGANRQFLVFPKSLKRFAGAGVVGIKYDLLEEPTIPVGQRAKVRAPKPVKKAPAKSKMAPKSKEPPKPVEPPRAKTPKPRKAKESTSKKVRPPSSKVVPFQPAEEKEEETEAVSEIKREVRHAMKMLEDGKQVAAFNLLERIVE